MSIDLASLSYPLGTPGMIASHSYSHIRQMLMDTFWVNPTASQNFYFGAAALVKSNVLAQPDGTASFGGKFLGVFVDPQKYFGVDYYAPKDRCSVMTMGEIWVRVPTNITINPWQDTVTYLEALTSGVGGVFSNAAAASGIIAVPNANFASPNINGIALLSLDDH